MTPSLCLSMIFSENRFPFPDHAQRLLQRWTFGFHSVPLAMSAMAGYRTGHDPSTADLSRMRPLEPAAHFAEPGDASTAAHFSMSARMKSANSFGVPPTGS